MTYRMETALVYAIRSGLKYKDLQQINLNDYHLPDHWLDFDSDNFINKMTVIRIAIATAKGLAEQPKNRETLEKIARDLEAPFEIIQQIAETYGGKLE